MAAADIGVEVDGVRAVDAASSTQCGSCRHGGRCRQCHPLGRRLGLHVRLHLHRALAHGGHLFHMNHINATTDQSAPACTSSSRVQTNHIRLRLREIGVTESNVCKPQRRPTSLIGSRGLPSCVGLGWGWLGWYYWWCFFSFARRTKETNWSYLVTDMLRT